MTTIFRSLLAGGAVVLPMFLMPAVSSEAAPSTTSDQVAPTVLLPNVQVAEGASGPGRFLVNVGLSAPNPFDHPVELGVWDFSTTPVPGGGGATYGTATPGTDYQAFAPFHLVFQPGQQVATFPITLYGDRVVEGSEEIDVRFADTELHLADNDIDLVITDDDTAGAPLTRRPLLVLPNQVVPEADTGCYPYRVSVLLDRRATAGGTVQAHDFTTVPVPGGGGTTYGTASPGTDYQAFGPATVVFSRGSRSSTLTIRVCGDGAREADEEIDARFAGTRTFAVRDNDIDLVLADDD